MRKPFKQGDTVRIGYNSTIYTIQADEQNGKVYLGGAYVPVRMLKRVNRRRKHESYLS